MDLFHHVTLIGSATFLDTKNTNCKLIIQPPNNSEHKYILQKDEAEFFTKEL